MDVAKVRATAAMAPHLNDPVYTRWNVILKNFNITPRALPLHEKKGTYYAENWLKMFRGPLLSEILATCLTDLLQQTLGYEM